MNKILKETKELIFDKCNFIVSNIEKEIESSEYCAHRFEVNTKKCLFRQAKITPTKIGQFVTLWKRKNSESPIEPFESTDEIDFVVVNVKSGTQFGQFVFPKSILIEKGIFKDNKEGKRAIRVYPIWDKTESNQAQKTQKWQLDYFFEIPNNQKLNINLAKKLFV